MINTRLLKDKRYVLLLICSVLAWLCWSFGFKNTLQAIRENQALKTKGVNSSLAYNPGYLKKKDYVVSTLVKHYTADSAGWKDGFFLNISRIALSKDANIEYSPAKLKIEADTSSSFLSQEIKFEGCFHNLIKLLDTLEKAKGLGLIKSARFITRKSQGQIQDRKLFLETSFCIVKESSKPRL